MNLINFSKLNILHRRRFLRLSGGSVALLGLAGCSTSGTTLAFVQGNALPPLVPNDSRPPSDIDRTYYASIYAARPEEKFPIPALPVERIDPAYFRQFVDDPTGERPGTVVVDTAHHFLYLTVENGKAMRYSVGLGRAGFEWAGRGVIQYKRAWPRWTPPDEMVARQPSSNPTASPMAAWTPVSTTPWGHARSISSRTERTHSTVSTARRNGGRSASQCLQDACVCSEMNQRLPIPIRAARKVGEVLKYMDAEQAVTTDYRKYI